MSTETTLRPKPGQYWVCNRPDSVPVEKRGWMPELCSLPCEAGWAAQHEITHEVATHVATDDGWKPVAAAPGMVTAVVDVPEGTTDDQADQFRKALAGEVEVRRVLPEPAGTWWGRIRTGWFW